jgi:Protein of unknown function (DUF2911)
MMKNRTFAIAITFVLFVNLASAQLTTVPDGGNKRASVNEQIGLTNVTINYNRPGVKGREGHIWGQLIPVGFVNPGFGTSKSAPWRAGANENTTIQFTTPVKIEGQSLPAGKYGFFVVYSPDECTLIFSKNSNSWGSFYYDPAEDALRVKVKPVVSDKSIEWLKYEFTDETPSAAVVRLEWEKTIIGFTIDVDLVATQLESFRQELRTDKGFVWENWDQAALYCARHKTNLEEALLWADTATSESHPGFHEFEAWNTKSMVLDSLGRTKEADEAMKRAVPFGDVVELYHYARLLAKKKMFKEAFEIYNLNNDKNPDDFIANLGFARGYAGIGNRKKALYYAKQAQSQAEGETNKNLMDKIVTLLNEGKDIN